MVVRLLVVKIVFPAKAGIHRWNPPLEYAEYIAGIPLGSLDTSFRW